ncbi:MAG TPA: 7-cyano-7-deazaguanine synthase QueC [Gemmatimonadales bacterium]|nr:7-cyano-7-deazaguanine synthase QueC [Gemmatimonadales bacterium]
MSRKAVVLLSGGMDSATTLAVARSEGFDCYALSCRYGQRHGVELAAARAVATALGAVDHVVVDLDLRQFGGSALTDDLPVPKDRPLDAIGEGIPTTYVPARNTILLALALAYAETLGARDLFLGVNALDYSGYPDCRPEFIAAFERVARLGTRAGAAGERFTIHAPLVTLTKAEIIARGLALGVDFGLTRTCYDPDPDGAACGRCDACRLRLRGFAQLGLTDPAPYRPDAPVDGARV